MTECPGLRQPPAPGDTVPRGTGGRGAIASLRLLRLRHWIMRLVSDSAARASLGATVTCQLTEARSKVALTECSVPCSRGLLLRQRSACQGERKKATQEGTTLTSDAVHSRRSPGRLSVAVF